MRDVGLILQQGIGVEPRWGLGA